MINRETMQLVKVEAHSDGVVQYNEVTANHMYLKLGKKMKMLELLESGHPISENDVKAFEEQLNNSLPSEIKEFYLKFNGGQPVLSCVHDDKHIFPVNSFYSLEEMKDHLDWFDDESFPEGFKKGDLLPFAYFPGNGHYSLSLRNHDYGKVYFYILEETAVIYGKWSSFEVFINSFITGE